MTDKELILLLQEENRLLKETIVQLQEHITRQDARINDLEEKLRKALLTRNSSNSSKPPSTDFFKAQRNQSLREKSEKKSGGQPGHKGSTLKMSDSPDEIIKLEPNYCNICGSSLDNQQAELQSKRQVIDIPPIRPIITEYQNYKKRCPNCGHDQQSDYPIGITNHVQYGSNVEAAIIYFSIYQYIPYKRLKDCLSHLLNINLSQGSIDNILNRMASKAELVYNVIKEKIQLSKQSGSDETSVKVNGKKWWIWVWQNILLTFIAVSDNRGSKTIDDLFPDGFLNSVLTSDRWAAQLKTQAKAHQLCIAHLLRDLKYLYELEKNIWSLNFKKAIKKSIELKSEQSEYNRNDSKVLELEHTLDVLLKEIIPKDINPKTHTFQQSLIKHRDSILTHLYCKDTPPDNNGSERAIRNVKVKQKISGQFKSGQKVFCILRSVVDTCLKNGIDVFFALSSIAKFAPAE